LAALEAEPRAKAFFATINAANRDAVLWRIHTAVKAETRARRIAQLVEMLARGETIHIFRRSAKACVPLQGSCPAAHHVEQPAHNAFTIGPQPVVGVLVGDPGTQSTHALGGVLGK
jgi:hypothetical protein